MSTEEMNLYSESGDLICSLPDTECDSTNILEPIITKNKLYYSVAEVSDIIGEKQHTIRYWSKHFPALKPHKRNSHRYYTAKQLDIFNIVKISIRKKNLTVAGTKKILKNYLKQDKIAPSGEIISTVSNNNNNNIIINKLDSSAREDNIILTKEEFIELLEVLQLLMLYIQTKN